MKHIHIATFVIGSAAGFAVAIILGISLAAMNERNTYDAHILAGQNAAQSGDTLVAEAHFMAAGAADPSDYGAWLALGKLFESEKRRVDAIRAYELALERIAIRISRSPAAEISKIMLDKETATRRLDALRAG